MTLQSQQAISKCWIPNPCSAICWGLNVAAGGKLYTWRFTACFPVAVIILDPSGEKLAFTTAPRCLFRTCLHVPSIIHTSMSSVRNYECWSVSRKPAPARRQLRFQSVESTPALHWKQRKGSCRMVLPSNGKLPPQKKNPIPCAMNKTKYGMSTCLMNNCSQASRISRQTYKNHIQYTRRAISSPLP